MKYNLTVDKGATFKQNVVYQDSDGIPIVITGSTARMQIRETFESPIIHELTTENGGITIDGPNGELDLIISATDTATFEVTPAIYDLELITNNGEVVRLLEGNVLISENVTI